QPGEKLVGVESRKQNFRQITVLALLLQMPSPLIGTLLHREDIFLLRGLVPEICRLKTISEFPDLFLTVAETGLAGEKLGDFAIGALAVEQTDEGPILGWKGVHATRAGNVDADNPFAALDVLLTDSRWVHARAALRNGTRGDLRQSNIQDPGEIHLKFSRRTLAVMPGRRFPAGPTSSARISIVPLDGSTTGLISMILTVCFSCGTSGEVNGSSWPVFKWPKNFSGRVNRSRSGH